MSNKRIVIIGCGGSGKSTLAKKLGSITRIPVIHLDKIYWKENWEHLTKEDFDQELQKELQKSEWIMDGNFNRTIQTRLTYCDTAIFLDFPRRTCLSGALRRIIRDYGKTRSDMAPGCPERINYEFFKWIWNFNKQNRQRYYEILKEAPHCSIYILHNRRETEELLKNWNKISDGK